MIKTTANPTVKRMLLFIGVLVAVLPSMAQAWPGRPVVATIRVIHASDGPSYAAPGLEDLVPELRSVFRYSSYHLLKRQVMELPLNASGRVAIPGGRDLMVMPVQVQGGRIRFSIQILHQNTQEFGTDILLKNAGSVTIGGPLFKGGVLLFTLSARLR